MGQTAAHATRRELARLLRHHRRERGLTQEQLAELAGLSARGIQDLERGLSVPRRDTLDRLVGVLGLDGEARVALEAAAMTRPRRTEGTAPAPRTSVNNNLSRHLTSFVGRENELDELPPLLARSSLLTLTGPGGVGKTRLALQLAHAVSTGYPDGVWLVELASLADAALIPHAIGAVLRVQEEPGRPVQDALTASLQQRTLLLVLDNCEHLAQTCAELVEALLRDCPRLTVCATSREPLGIPGETTWQVRPLSPAAAQELFIERAVAALPGLLIEGAERVAVAEICRRLDGIPLAIELAAARVPGLTLAQLAFRLDKALGLLTSTTRTTPPRHRTLEALLDWSYAMLSEPEQVLFRRLSVFANGWTLEAAESVCADDVVAPGRVPDLLLRLVARSLVVAEPDLSGSMRYRLLEVLRQYAHTRLEASTDLLELEARMLDYFVALTQPVRQGLASPECVHWLNVLDAERDNLRAALRWSLESGDPASGLRMVWGLGPYWEIRGHPTEGYRITRALLDAEPGAAGASAVRARALAVAAQLAGWSPDLSLARRLAAEEGLEMARRADDAIATGENLFQLGACAVADGDAIGAERLFIEASEAARSVGAMNFEAMFALGLAETMLLQGRHADAQRWLERALQQCRDLGHDWGVSEALRRLGTLAIERQDAYTARAYLIEAGRIRYRLGDAGHLPFVFAALGDLAGLEGDTTRALRLYGAGDALRRATHGTGFFVFPRTLERIQRARDSVTRELGADAAARAWAVGAGMSLDQATNYALGQTNGAPCQQEPGMLSEPERVKVAAQTSC